MTATIPYLRRRDGVLQYERRVPLHVRQNRSLFAAAFQSRPLFRRSLRTKCHDEAALLYPGINREFEALLRGSQLTASTVPQAEFTERRVTDHDLASIAARYESLIAEPFERLHRKANVCPVAAAELSRLESELELDAEDIRAALRDRNDESEAIVLRPVHEADALIKEVAFFAPVGSEIRGAIIGAVRSGMEQGYRRVADLSTGQEPPRLAGKAAPTIRSSSLTLADAVERYVSVRQPSAKAISETRLALRQFEKVVGRKALAAITRDEVYSVVEHLSKQMVGGKTTGSVVRPLSEQSIRKRLRMLGSAVNFVRDRQLFTGDNPFADLRLSRHVAPIDKAVMPSKRRFQISELNAVFTHPWFTGCESDSKPYSPGNYRLTDERFWVPVLALFTGCRAGELGGMKVSEVRLNDRYPHFIVRDNEYRRTKSGRARSVPILDALLDLGFAEYVASVSDGNTERLFPRWVAPKRKGATEADDPAWSNSGVVRAFNRNVVPATLGSTLPTGARREVTFHSFRGAFKAMVGTWPNVPSLIYDEVVGHKQSDLNERYIGEVTIEETYPVMRGCSFKGLHLLTAPPSDRKR